MDGRPKAACFIIPDGCQFIAIKNVGNSAFPEVETDGEDEQSKEEEGEEKGNGDDEDEDESMDSDDEDDEETVENESDSSDPWENLWSEVNPSYVEQVERFLDEGASRAVAKAKALKCSSTRTMDVSKSLYAALTVVWLWYDCGMTVVWLLELRYAQPLGCEHFTPAISPRVLNSLFFPSCLCVVHLRDHPSCVTWHLTLWRHATTTFQPDDSILSTPPGYTS